jgi:hypothetical protein
MQTPVLVSAGTNMGVSLVYGTGTAPGFNGTGGTGVPFAANVLAASGAFQSQNLFGIVSGLAIGVTYWFDLALITTTAASVTVGHNAPNDPVIFTLEEF